MMQFWPWKAKSTHRKASTPAQPAAEEQAAIAHIFPEEGRMPANAWTIDELEQALRAEIARCGAGELDGHGQCLETGELEIFTYGPDADTLASIVNEVVVRFPKGPGSYLVKRYGKTGAREERIELL